MNLLVVLFSNFEIRLLAGRCFLCVSKVALALFSGDLFLHRVLGLVLVLTMSEIDRRCRCRLVYCDGNILGVLQQTGYGVVC